MYGSSGRIVAAIAALAGVVSAFVAAAQAANLFSLVPQKYAWITIALPIVSLFIVGFSERLQGGASKPDVRAAAEASDRKEAAQSRAGNGNTLRVSVVPVLILALFIQFCGGTAGLTYLRAVLASSTPLVNSLVVSSVIKSQAAADNAIQSFSDGAGVALTLQRELNAIPKDAPDKRAQQVTAVTKAFRAWRAIIARGYFAIAQRIQKAADIADGIFASLVVFYSEPGPMLNSARAKASVVNAKDADDFEQQLKQKVNELKRALEP